MNTRYLMFVGLMAAFALAGCRGGDNNAPSTVTKIAASEIAGNTGETTAPIEINDLPISAADSKDSTEPKPVN